MSSETIDFLPHNQRIQFEEEAKKGGFSEPMELVRELVLDYLEMRRVEVLVVEGLNDPNVAPYSKQEFEEVKQEILENGKAGLRKTTN